MCVSMTGKLVGSLVETHVFFPVFLPSPGSKLLKVNVFIECKYSINIFVCFTVSMLVGEEHGVIDNIQALTSKNLQPTVLERQEK